MMKKETKEKLKTTMRVLTPFYFLKRAKSSFFNGTDLLNMFYSLSLIGVATVYSINSLNTGSWNLKTQKNIRHAMELEKQQKDVLYKNIDVNNDGKYNPG